MLPAQENWIVTEVQVWQVESGFQEKGEIQESKVGKQKEHLSKNQGTQGPMESQTDRSRNSSSVTYKVILPQRRTLVT